MNDKRLHRLETALKALANGSRLRLLLHLQTARRMRDISVTAGKGGAWGGASRPLTRQAVSQHLKVLESVGAVVRSGESKDDAFSVSHAGIFQLTEEIRSLARLRGAVDADVTQVLDRPVRGALHQGPSLVVVRGVGEGRSFPMDQPGGAVSIGRSREADICLDYDPYISSMHATVVEAGGQHLLAATGSRNPTLLNWEPLKLGALAPLQSGDVIGLGLSLLVYRCPASRPART